MWVLVLVSLTFPPGEAIMPSSLRAVSFDSGFECLSFEGPPELPG